MPDARQIHEVIDILLKYPEEKFSGIQGELGEVWLPGPPPDKITEGDRNRLEELNFKWEEGMDSWHAWASARM